MNKQNIKRIAMYFSFLWTLITISATLVWKGSEYLHEKEKQAIKIEQSVEVQKKDIDKLNKAMEKNDSEHKEIGQKVNDIHSDVKIIRILLESRKLNGGEGYAKN